MGRNISPLPYGLGPNLPPPDLFGYIAGRYYLPTINENSSNAVFGATTGVIYYAPFYCRRTHTFTKIGWRNGSGSNDTKSYRIGIYNSNSTGEPASLVQSFAEVTIADTTTNVDRLTTATIPLSGGVLYWLAITVSGTMNMIGLTPSLGAFGELIGLNTLATLSAQGFASSHTYAALPSTAPSIYTAGTFTDRIPLIALAG